MEAFAYFPAHVYREEHPEWVDHTNKMCEKHYAWIKENGNINPNIPVIQTGHMAHDPDLAYLTSYFQNTGVEILKSQGYITDRYDFYVSGMWGQDIQCYGGHRKHIHKNSQISGFYFTETPENGCYPVLHDPRSGKEMIELDYAIGEELNNANGTVHFNNVMPGTFLFFNSWLPHEFTTSSSDKPTKFIHFILSHKDKDHQCNII